MGGLGALAGWRLFPWATAFTFRSIVYLTVGMDGVAIELDLPKRIPLRPFLTALRGRLWLSFSLTNILKLSSLSLLLSSTFRVDGPRVAVRTFVNVRDSLWVFIVADDMLPCIALLAQHGATVVLLETADALDRGGLFLFDGTG
jgi:hypothetical protein